MKDVKCKLCINYRNEWCAKVIDSPDPDTLRDCHYFSHMTNGDRIRQMTDEELAEDRANILCDLIEKLQGMCKETFRYSREQFVSSYLAWLKERIQDD